MKLLRLLFCLVLSLNVSHAKPPAAAPSIPKEVIAAAHQTTYHIGFQTLLDSHVCSGTAIAPHALLTATHCELGTDALYIEGQRKPAHIANVLRDKFDHSILLLDTTFEHYAGFAKGEPAPGDDVFVFGNPGGFTDLFRHGYFAGVQRPHGFAALFGGPSELVFDFNAYHGDSGEAIFDAEGKIITVTSVGEIRQEEKDGARIQLVGAYAVAFTDAQLKQAADYNPPPAPPEPADDDDDGPGGQ